MSQTSTVRSQPKHDDLRTRVWFEHGHLVRENYQPTRKAVLEETRELRNLGVRFDVPFGRVALQIPQLDYQRLLKKYPDLRSPDAHTSTQAWKKFMRTSEAKKYWLSEKI